jgi:hypothetical protein
MAKQQATKQQQASKSSAQTKSSPPQGNVRGQGRTGERDENYDLISVLYHALQGAETVAQYIQDAQQSNDEELVEFLEETREEYADRAAEARELLKRRLAGTASEEEEEEEEEDDEEEEEEED